MSFSEKQHESKNLRGMERALKHAIDMNRDGRLDEGELDEFRRYLIGETLGHLPMEEHIRYRNSRVFEKLWENAGQNADDAEERHPQDMQKDRTALAIKIVADYLSRLWESGELPDEAYESEMAKLGLVPDEVEQIAAEGKDGEPIAPPEPNDRATKIWARDIGLEDEPPVEEEEDEVAAYMKTRSKEIKDEPARREKEREARHNRR